MDSPAVSPGNAVPRWRWWIHLGLFTMCIAAILIRPAVSGDGQVQPLIPQDVAGLLKAVVLNLAVFAAIVGAAWLASRASIDDFLLRWRRGVRPIVLGAVYSVAIRVVLMMMVMAVMVVVMVTNDASTAQHVVEKLRPDTAKLIAPEALTHNPVYLGICLTLVSFVLAGFREELWRSGMILGIVKLLEPRLTGRGARAIALVFSAMLFGLGHYPQGWGAVVLTAVLGLAFGMMMLHYKSIWEAVFAHGFFDATTFFTIYVIVKYFPGKIPGF